MITNLLEIAFFTNGGASWETNVEGFEGDVRFMFPLFAQELQRKYQNSLNVTNYSWRS